ncbi:MAG: response regulator [Desulfobacterales bacterium]|nr:response regulator [Desulfobacterales bacterium]
MDKTLLQEDTQHQKKVYKFLIVDNDPVMLKGMSYLLKQEGMEVVCAKDGLSALDILTSFIPDIMIVDLFMPNISGDKLIQIVRKMEHLKNCFIMIISGAAVEMKIDYQTIGANACMAKKSFMSMKEQLIDLVNRFDEIMLKKTIDIDLGMEGQLFSRKMTEELLIRNQHLERVLANTDDGIMEMSQGRVVYVNPAASLLFAQKEEQMLSVYLPSLFDENLSSTIESALNSPSVSMLSLEFNSKYLDLKLLPVKDMPDNRILIIQDVSDRKEAENIMVCAKETAENANRSKSQFLANMSHEIRSPLNAIIGLTEVMLIKDATPTQEKNLKIIHSSANTLLRVINDILDFSKIEADKLDIQVIPFDIKKVIDELNNIFVLQANQKGISFYVSVPENLPRFLMGDPVRLNQILINIIGNAIKFTQQGSVHVQLSVLSETDKHIQLRLSVEDTGAGIPENFKPIIYTSFSQADGSYQRKFEGTGLGLAISKRLVEIMGGEIDFTSQLGKGTTFWVILNFEKSLSQNVPPETVREPVEIAPSTLSQRILLVEDKPFNQHVVKSMLENFQVDVANNGKEALTLLKKIEFDLILMDVQMPELDGFEATKYIRDPASDILNHDVPIIAMTAHAMQGDRERCIQSGMNNYLSKPFSVEDLNNIIHMYLGNHTDLNTKDEHQIISDQPVLENYTFFSPNKLYYYFSQSKELAHSFVSRFLKEKVYTISLLSIQNAITHGRQKESLKAVHGFKGALSYFSDIAHQQAAILEQNIKQGESQSTIQNDFELLKQNIGELVKELEQFMKDKNI